MPRRLALIALLAAAPLTALAQPGPGGPPAVGVVKAEPTEVTETSQFVGRIEAVRRVNLIARVTGFLEKRYFEEGSEVHAGDLLYRIEQPPFQAQVAQQQANVAQANALLLNNTQTLQRQQALANTPAGQQSLVDSAVAQQRSAAAQLAAAQAQLKVAQINLDYTDIKAPIDGKISRTAVNEGNVVGPSTGTLATIVSQDPMYVTFPISVRAAIDLRDRYADKGGFNAVVIKLQLPDGTLYAQPGHLDYVDPTIATNTDTLLLRGEIPNPLLPGAKPGAPGDRALTDGEFVTVLLEGVQPVSALAIPRAAVLSDQQGSYVWVVGEGDKVERRAVQLGQSTPDKAVISAGLKDGEVVVVDGVQRVRPGIVVNPGPAAAGPTLAPQAPRT
jgi:membrane fusion protein (multidrug efflux system)